MAKNEQTAGPYWTKNWIEAMWRFTVENFVEFDTGAVDFEALGREEYEFRKALFYRNFKNSQRAKEAFAEVKESYKAHVESGRQGGRPRKDATTQQPAAISTSDQREGDTGPVDSMGRTDAPSRTLPLPTWESFLSFVDGEGLDYSDAREWWEMTMVDRKGHDRNGKPIGNWKGALKRFCTTKTTNRRSA